MEIAGWWLACVTVWLACLTVVTPAEAVVAAVVAMPCAWAARRARRRVAADWRLRARWFAELRRLPVTVVRDTVRMWLVAAREPAATGRTREVDVGAEAERAVRVALLSTSPGTVVVDLNEERVRVHEIGR